jgi:hypothetical protein
VNATDQPALKSLPSSTGYYRDWGYACMGMSVGVVMSLTYALLVFRVYLSWAWFLALGVEILGMYLIGKQHRSRIHP